MQKIVLIFLFSVLLFPVWGTIDEPQKIKTAKDTISDQEICRKALKLMSIVFCPVGF